MFSVAKKSCRVCPGRRAIASYRRFARSRMSRASFLYPFFSRNTKISFVSVRFCEVWQVQLSPGQRAGIPPSPTNQSRSNRKKNSVLQRQCSRKLKEDGMNRPIRAETGEPKYKWVHIQNICGRWKGNRARPSRSTSLTEPKRAHSQEQL